jgi:hypothetical protein
LHRARTQEKLLTVLKMLRNGDLLADQARGSKTRWGFKNPLSRLPGDGEAIAHSCRFSFRTIRDGHWRRQEVLDLQGNLLRRGRRNEEAGQGNSPERAAINPIFPVVAHDFHCLSVQARVNRTAQTLWPLAERYDAHRFAANLESAKKRYKKLLPVSGDCIE